VFLFGVKMIKVARLMLEMDAAEEAHQKGLTSAAFGKWKDKTGNVTHLTDPKTGKLVPVKGDEDTTSQKVENPAQGQPKPKSTSAHDAGVAPNNTPTAQDIQKTAKTSQPATQGNEAGEDNFAKTPSGAGSPMMAVIPNPHVTQMKLEVGKPIDKSKIKDYYPRDPHNVLTPEIIGENVVLLTKEEKTGFFHQTRPVNNYGQYQKIAAAQNEWRNTLPPKERKALLEMGLIWQEGSVRTASDYKKKLVNKVLETICKKRRPQTKINEPLERGMKLLPEDAVEFLKNFRIGEMVELPPSGFSLDKTYARDYAWPNSRNISVVLRLAPKKDGTIYGLHLSDVDDNTRKMFAFEDEFEVVRYPGPTARCVGVTKMIADSGQNQIGHELPSVGFIIDLEEQGFEDDHE
jgi:hypothetical protein